MTPAEIRSIRESLGLSQEELAAALDVDVRSVRRWETGAQPIHTGNADGIRKIKDSDNFKVNRRIIFVNGITDRYMFTIEGFCSIAPEDKKLTVTCKVGDGYKRDYLGLSDNVTYMVEQLDGASVSPDHYIVNFKPETILPDIQQH